MKNWLKNHRWHIMAWCIFILYEYAFVAMVMRLNRPLLSYAIHYSINICLFYIHADFVLKKTLRPQKPAYAVMILLIIVELGIFSFSTYAADSAISVSGKLVIPHFKIIEWKFLSASLWRGIYFLLFSTAYYFISRFIQQKQRTAVLEKAAAEKALKEKQIKIELANAKNCYLKAQINPHFLFNTLTYIYNSTHKSEPRAAEAVRYLTKIIRYALECEHGPDMMPLKGEILQVENLLQLSRIKQPNLFVDFNYSEEIETIEIIPLVLISLTENMIKHGNLSVQEDAGKIDISLSDGFFKLETTNLINTGLNDLGFHTGLRNIKQRLYHAYGEEAVLTYGRDGQNHFFTKVLICIEREDADPIRKRAKIGHYDFYKETGP
ncbi:sensor histidine kinase [Pedobacter sp. GSP4]|uniref:sensor histidine kinase n=1 Tax=Pedobacter sp. GSP4 TaxID=3453716 RepID=UPI003EED43BB